MAVFTDRTGGRDRTWDLAVNKVVDWAGEQVGQLPKGLEFGVFKAALLKGVKDGGGQSGLNGGIGDCPV